MYTYIMQLYTSWGWSMKITNKVIQKVYLSNVWYILGDIIDSSLTCISLSVVLIDIDLSIIVHFSHRRSCGTK